jgi:hypothetical protein
MPSKVTVAVSKTLLGEAISQHVDMNRLIMIFDLELHGISMFQPARWRWSSIEPA